MGATNFATTGRGKTAAAAFKQVVEEALYEHGHGGYTGTIAEKHSFTEVKVPQGLSVQDFVDAVECEDVTKHPTVRNAVKLYTDKWGPAVCIQTGPEEWLFIGLASD